VHTGFRWRNLRERDHLEDPGIDGRKILKWIFSKWDVGGGEMGGINLAQDKERWQKVINMVMNLGVP